MVDVTLHQPAEADASFYDAFATIDVKDDDGGSISIFVNPSHGDFLVELADAVRLVTGVMIHGETRPTE